MYEFRKNQVDKLKSDPTLEEGDVSCVNLTILNGGVQFNVIPVTFSATFDVRLVPDFDLKAFEKQVCKLRFSVNYETKVRTYLIFAPQCSYMTGAKKLAAVLK